MVALYLLGSRAPDDTYLLTYFLTQLVRAYEAGNISETVQGRAKVTINGLYKVVHGLSIAAKVYDLEWPLREIKGRWFLKCRKNGEIQLSNDTAAMQSGWLHYICKAYVGTRALTYLLTQFALGVYNRKYLPNGWR